MTTDNCCDIDQIEYLELQFFRLACFSIKDSSDNYSSSVREHRMTISVNRLFNRLQRCVKVP